MGLFRRRSDDLFSEGDIIPSSTHLEPIDSPADETTGRRCPEQEKMFKKEGYGIQQAIKLMRNLPKNDQDIVMTVVKQTLKSMGIKVVDIISDAETKEKAFIQLLATTRTELADFKEIVETKEHEIVTLEAVLKETSAVKEKFMYVEEISQGQALDDSATIPEDHPHIRVLQHEKKTDEEDTHQDEEIPVVVAAESIEPEATDAIEVPVLQQLEPVSSPVSEYPHLETIELDRDTASTIGRVIKDTITKVKSASKSKSKTKSKTKSQTKTKSKAESGAKSKTKSKGKSRKKETA